MFDALEQHPADPILGIGLLFAQDPNPAKVNLGVGVYQDETGATPIFEAVKLAEQQLLDAQTTKAYIAQAGDDRFLSELTSLVLGPERSRRLQDRVRAITTIGGSGALQMAAKVVKQARPDVTLWVPDPTWANHFPLLESTGVTVRSYPYYDATTGGVSVDRMLDSLNACVAGDVIVLHGSCHNPTGADLSETDWEAVIQLALKNRLVPLIDVAYQGFAVSLDDDVFGVRLALDTLPEVLVSVSCSKTFGMYRERVGALLVGAGSSRDADAAFSQVLTAARRSYSMPPYHGAAVVGYLLADDTLRANWEAELAAARQRIVHLRQRFAEELSQAQNAVDYSFITNQQGMFSLLGLTSDQVDRLRQEHSVYLVGSSRANLAGLTDDSVTAVAKAIADVQSCD